MELMNVSGDRWAIMVEYAKYHRRHAWGAEQGRQSQAYVPEWVVQSLQRSQKTCLEKVTSKLIPEG